MSRPTIYTTASGDTFSSVSRSATGSEASAAKIRASNPGATEPFQSGVVLTIPAFGDGKTKTYRADGIDFKVGGVPVDTLDSFRVTLVADGFRKCEISTANEIQTRAIFPQMQSTPVDIGYNGRALLTGYTDAPKADSSDTRNGMGINVMSDPHLLLSSPPTSAFPMEFKDSDLSVMADRLCGMYSLDNFFDVDPGPRFSKVAIAQNEKPLNFLAKLAKQRAQVITDDAFGSVVFTDGAGIGAPVLIIDDEERPDVTISAEYSMANYYSSVTGVLKSKRGRTAKSKTVNNPHYRGIIKPHEFEISESDEGELETAVNSVMGRMFADSFKVNITVPGWDDRNGNVIAPQSKVKIRSPNDWIEDWIELDIRTVALVKSPNKKTAVLSCVLPGVFGGIIPEVVPWT